jgi:hypothetical protein
MRILFSLFLLAPALTAQPNTLSPQQRRAGWALLFDGKTFRNWRDPGAMSPPGDGWKIEDGCIRSVAKSWIRDDLLTSIAYDDFEFQFDFRLTPGANSGIKYRIQHELFMDSSKMVSGPNGFEGMVGREIENPKSGRASLARTARGEAYTVGFEFQLLDDERHLDALRGADKHTGALYSMIPPSTKPARPPGQWNSARLVVQGKHVEHWINGVKVLDALLDDARVREHVAKRWAPAPMFRALLTNPMPDGPFALQHHGDEVWFRNLKVREIPRLK